MRKNLDIDAQRFAELLALAEQGDAKTQFSVGEYYRLGAESNWSNGQPTGWHTKPPQGGHSWAKSEAVAWYRKAAEQNEPRAQYALGNAYALGEGVRDNYTKAAEWFGKATALGNLEAQSALALACARGRGVKKDYDKALELLKDAANKGYMPDLSLRRIASIFSEIATLKDPKKLESAATVIGIIPKRPDTAEEQARPAPPVP